VTARVRAVPADPFAPNQAVDRGALALARFDTLADDARKRFFLGLDDVGLWKQILRRLGESIKATLGKYATELLSDLIKRQQGVWEEIAIRHVHDSERPNPRWGFFDADERAEEQYEFVVRELVLELVQSAGASIGAGGAFKDPSRGVNDWHDIVHREYPLPRFKLGRNQIPEIQKGSEHVCRKLRVNALEQGNNALAGIFSRFADRFNKLECRDLKAFLQADSIQEKTELDWYINHYPQPEPVLQVTAGVVSVDAPTQPELGTAIGDNDPELSRDGKGPDSSQIDSLRQGSAPPLSPPRRTPNLQSSRERLQLVNILASELATIKYDLRRYCTAEDLKKKHPDFTLWDHISDGDLKELVDGVAFTPKAYAENLTLRKFGITSRETLKKDRKKLRKARKATLL
jgi:hypothetical protein